MTFETPERVDLSNQDDIAKLKANLTPDEQQRLDEYFSAEKQGIIYLTQEELGDLKYALEYENNHHRDRNEVIGEFIAEQKAEGFSLGDILEGQEGIPENIDTIDELAHTFLFGENGLCKDIYLSETAQDHFAGGFSLALVEFISKQEDLGNLLGENGKLQLSENTFQELEKSISSLLILGELSRKTEVVETPVGPQKNKTLDLLGNGETNSIIMNLGEGKDFFLGVLSGELDAVKMQEILEAENNSDNIESDIGEVQSELLKQAQKIQEKISTPDTDPDDLSQSREAPQNILTDTQTAIDNAETPEEKSIWEQFLKLLEDFFQGFIGITAGTAADNSETPREIPADSTEDVSSIEAIKNSLLGKLSEGAFTGMREESLKSCFENDENLKKIDSILSEIPTLGEQDTSEEKLTNLLFTSISSDAEVMKINAFIDTGGLEGYKNADNSLNTENFINILTAYKNYRLAYDEDKTLSYEAYFTNNNE